MVFVVLLSMDVCWVATGNKLVGLGIRSVRGLLEKYPTFGREKETGLLGALDT